MIYSYHRPSGASKLAARLRLAITYLDDAVVLRPTRDKKPDLNWGCSGDARVGQDGGILLNKPAAVKTATSKVETFKALQEAELPVPRFSTRSVDELRSQLPPDRAVILRQDRLSGGRNMMLVPGGTVAIPDAGFRVDFIVEKLSCLREFRFHVFLGEVIHKQAKFVPNGFDGIARNWENGCYFTSEGLERFATEAQLRDLEQLAIRAVEVIGLDFGAVDMLITRKYQKPYVLEVNTAPGLRSDKTYAAYEGAFRKLYNA